MFAVIFIPDFSLQAVLRNELELWSRPVALLDDRETKAMIFQMTQAAREAGVAEGLTSTQALAHCENVIIKTRSLLQEQTANEILLQTAYNFSPRIEATADGICTMDLQALPVAEACNRHDVDRVLEWASNILASLAKLNLRAHIGIAETPNLALHAARRTDSVLFVEGSTEFISTLPFESLDPSPAIADILRRWGIRTVGDFTFLQRDKIAERLGPEGLDLFERASATDTRPLNLITPSEKFVETMDFEIEIESLQPLLFVLRRFVEQLTRRISLRFLAVAELELQLRLSSGEKYESLFKVPSPTANIDILFRMLQTHLETVRTDSTIIGLQLSAQPGRNENYQFGLFEAALRDPNQFSETLARLTALCGNENIGSPVLENSFRPDAFKMETPRFDAATLNPQLSTLNSFGLRLRRFRPAFHIDVEVVRGKPAFIASLRLNSSIEKAIGPWRSSGDWWEQEKRWNRDEWDVQTPDGSLYRIYHENEDWFLEGVYD